jgi:hypothetical protein
MRKFPVIAAALLSIAVIGTTALVRAADEATPPAPATPAPATQPVDAGAKSGGRVSFKPYSGLTSLSSEQVERINSIHKKFLDDERELQKKHEADCIAVLSDAQKQELKDLHEKELADGKAKRAEQRKTKDK